MFGGSSKKNDMIFSTKYLTKSKVLAPSLTYGIWFDLAYVDVHKISSGHLALSYGNKYETEGGVRPVVILDNNININYVNGVWTVSSEE